MAALPNFFPHVYHINRGELPLEDQPFEKIFRHDINSVLGTGSTGTIVYKGKLGDREIAIRRVAKIFSNTIGKEIAVMLLNNNHPNILRYYAREVDADYFFIGMELCEGNLATFIADKTLKQKISPKQILQQSAEGLHYLHRSTLSNFLK